MLFPGPTSVRPQPLNTVMLKLIAEAIKASPDMNAYIEYNRRNNVGNIHYRDQIYIATPMMTPAQRMITPVLRDVGDKSLREVCEAMEALARRANNTRGNGDYALVL